ncbi:metal ABC transporter substrate-binding protein [Cellulomonas sp. ATA003]|nr:metal ABC transporter substrate-binding protein [Cellulomonas sp. ATA003]WNB84620.1 metal ABC transporter substrate-binding protein [Cellulomonas sp. ATA003]
MAAFPALVLAAVVALTGCAVPPSARAAAEVPDDGRPVVLTTFTVLADMARQVAGRHVRVESVVDVGVEIHGYEPTPDDLRRAADADLVLDNGLGLEAWSERFLARLDAPHVTVSDGVATIPIESGGSTGQPNPHAWMSPDAAIVYVANIADALAELDPAHAADFRANARTYSAELRAVRDALVDRLERLDPDRRALVTCEGAFSYLARDAGLAEAYLWPVSSDAQGTPQGVARAITFVREREVPAVFCESTVSDTAQRQVARETGARFGGVLYVDSLSGPDGPVPTFLDLLRHDTEVVAAALTGSSAGASS